MKLKKLLGVLLAGACVVSGLAGTGEKVSAADEPNYKLTETVGDGEVVLTLEFEGGTSVYAGNYTINYDNTVFQIVSTALGTANANILSINPITQEEWEEDNDEPYAPENSGEVLGNFLYTKGYKKGGTDVAVITLKLLKDSFSKDDITFTRANLMDKDANSTAVTPKIVVECSHAKTHDVEKVPATCSQEGSVETVCDVCGEVVETTSVSKTDHKWDEGKVTTEPKCEKEGVKTFTCTECGATKTEPVAALKHDWDEGKVTTDPKCEKEGVKTFTCKNDPEHTKTEPVAALGHKWESYEIVKAETEEEDGEIKRTCSVCGETITEKIPKLEAKNFELKDAEGKDSEAECKVGDTLELKAEVFTTATGAEDQIGDIRYVPASYKIGDEVTAFEGTDYTIKFTPATAGEQTIAVQYTREVFGATGWVADPETYSFDTVVTATEKAADNDKTDNNSGNTTGKDDGDAATDNKNGNTAKDNKGGNAATDNKNGNTATDNKGGNAATDNKGNGTNNGKTADTAKTTPKTGDSVAVMMILVALLGVSGATVLVVRKRREF